MTFEPLVGNKAIEDAAIDYVMKLERQAGREPQDRRYEAAFPADISSPPRTIEVKAVGKDQRGWFVPVETRQYEAALADANFFFYVVDNLRQGDPSVFRLKVFAGEQLQRLMKNAKKREYWELPIPVGEFDSAPGPEAISSTDATTPTKGTTRDARLAQLTAAMLDIYRNAKREAHYDAKIFLGLVVERGGLETALFLVHREQPSDGYTALYERQRLDLTVEALVVKPEWSDLFTEDDRTAARQRLEAYRFDVDKYLERIRQPPRD